MPKKNDTLICSCCGNPLRRACRVVENESEDYLKEIAVKNGWFINYGENQEDDYCDKCTGVVDRFTFKPNHYAANHPWGSCVKCNKSESVALNIMVVLAQTGNAFRELSWNEYRHFRLANECTLPTRQVDGEQRYFEAVIKYTTSNIMAFRFCKDW